MGFKLRHISTGTVFEMSKEPDLPLVISMNENQDIVKTTGGIRHIFKTMISEEEFTLQLKGLNHYDRKLLSQFWKETVLGLAEKFEMTIQIDHQEPLQVGSIQDGNPITVGTVLAPDCGDPGGPITVGQWVRQDKYIFQSCRFVQKKLTFTDSLPYNFDTTLQLVQELP